MLFKNLIELQREKGPNSRGKKCSKPTCSLSSPENQEIIRNADKISKRKEELAKAKSEAYKRFLEEEKKKRKNLLERKKHQ